ncbi:MAG: hypothetical protein Q7T03_07090 [Deltaproteobacteria bacterium]|nr:hypothetical protein [Deltaproteobacteria bacterium]
MKEKKLFKVCHELRDRWPNLALMAIGWMHFTNARQSVTEKILVGKKAPGVFYNVARCGWILWKGLSVFCLVLFLRWDLRCERKALAQKRFEVIGKTWSFGPDSSKETPDFYYGNLQEKLAKEGLNFLLLCGNVQRKEWRRFARGHVRTEGLCRLPELCLVSPVDVLKSVLLQIKTSFFLLKKSRHEKDLLARTVLEWAACDVLRQQTLFNMLHYFLAKSAVALWHPQAFLTFYEGHAWEKCIWKGVKEISPGCKTFGYQHTVIMQRASDLLVPAPDGNFPTMPDVVLCSGQRSFEMMGGKANHPQTKFVVFGSFRAGKTSGVKMAKAPPSLRRTVLVTPEGLLPEAVLLFDAAMMVAKNLQDHRFIFRSHPVLPFERVRPHLKIDPATLSNIEISTKPSIEEDFDLASVLLYRGSSAVFYAILKGLKPFYFHRQDLEVIDPVFELTYWKIYVNSEKELGDGLKDYEKTDIEKNILAWQVAEKYVKDYNIPVEKGSIDLFLASMQISERASI